MFALEAMIDRLRTARLVVRALELVKELGPYAAIELLLPGGSLIALGLWLYSRHKAGKPLLPFALRMPGMPRAPRALRTVLAAARLYLLERPLRPSNERFDAPVAGMALRGCSSCG